MPVLTIRLPAELHERFLAECEKRDTSPSEFGRKAIEAIIDHMPNRPSPQYRQETTVLAAPHKQQAAGIRGFTMDGEPIYDGAARPNPKKGKNEK